MNTVLRKCLTVIFVNILVLSFAAGRICAASTERTLSEIQVHFKLDPRITKSLYMGDRWVSPATYTMVGDDRKCVVAARATGIDKEKVKMNINPVWEPTSASMVQVSPTKGSMVEITVLEEGRSELFVTSGKVSMKVTIRATRLKGNLRVEITR